MKAISALAEVSYRNRYQHLKWVRATRNAQKRLACWVLRLQEYNSTNQHVPGKENYFADLKFCIDHVGLLEAIGVQNWSSIFNSNPSKSWAVLVAGSNIWENYRHQADVCRAYQVVRENNVPPENIITFAYDDVANNP
ncbi:hypothetical protein T265_15452, partial [Opisthorchis viverrini]